jgi:hypothetical protein
MPYIEKNKKIKIKKNLISSSIHFRRMDAPRDFDHSKTSSEMPQLRKSLNPPVAFIFKQSGLLHVQ